MCAGLRSTATTEFYNVPLNFGISSLGTLSDCCSHSALEGHKMDLI